MIKQEYKSTVYYFGAKFAQFVKTLGFMKKNCFILIGFLFVFQSKAQENEGIGEAIDSLTYAWDMESAYLGELTGFKRFCDKKLYRNEVIHMLNDIHHYDSVLYDRLVKAQRYNHDKEIAKTIDDISKFEQEYSMKAFLKFLNSECASLHKIERHRKDLENDIGNESYDGQIYVLLTEMGKYLHHITKRVDLLRKHVHHLHIK
ncbi:MAG: hypothetical protein GY816_07975 [Cytophagales bacterium]|nr:hypothetical protein [Cytophagales bacterium]